MVGNSRDDELRAIADLLREAASRLDNLTEPAPAPAPPKSQHSQPAKSEPKFVQPGSPVPALTEMLLVARRELRDVEAELAAADARVHAAAEERNNAHGHLAALENGWGERAAFAPSEEEALEAYRRDEEIARQAIEATTQRLEVATRHAAETRDRLAQYRAHIASLEAQIEQRLEHQRRNARAQPSDAPVRLLALRALDELRAPAPSGTLGDYIHVRFGREIRSDRWGALRRDEQRSFESHQRRDKSRDAWLCPAIDPDSGSADTSLWTRSDWPWSLRLKTEDNDTLELRLLYRLGRLALDPPAGTHDPDGLIDLARRELDRIRGIGHAQTTLEEIDERCDVIRQRLTRSTSGDEDVDGRAHNPADDEPENPPWLEHAHISDDEAGKLFGIEAEIPF